jgi:hypothetical protein
MRRAPSSWYETPTSSRDIPKRSWRSTSSRTGS